MKNPIIEEMLARYYKYGKHKGRVIPDRSGIREKSKKVVTFESTRCPPSQIEIEADRREFQKLWRDFCRFMRHLDPKNLNTN